jgi:hypothetical protein
MNRGCKEINPEVWAAAEAEAAKREPVEMFRPSLVGKIYLRMLAEADLMARLRQEEEA